MTSRPPSLDPPPPLTRCPVCGEFQELVGFCGACGWSEEGIGEATASVLRADALNVWEGRSEWHDFPTVRQPCVECHGVARLDEDHLCATCAARLRVEVAERQTTEDLLREWAEGAGDVLVLSLEDQTLPVAAVYKAARRAAGWALDVLGREARQ